MMSTIKDNKYIWIAFWMWLSFLTPAKAASGEIDVQDIVFSTFKTPIHGISRNGTDKRLRFPAYLGKSEERGMGFIPVIPSTSKAGRITIIISPGKVSMRGKGC